MNSHFMRRVGIHQGGLEGQGMVVGDVGFAPCRASDAQRCGRALFALFNFRRILGVKKADVCIVVIEREQRRCHVNTTKSLVTKWTVSSGTERGVGMGLHERT